MAKEQKFNERINLYRSKYICISETTRKKITKVNCKIVSHIGQVIAFFTRTVKIYCFKCRLSLPIQ